MEKQRLEIEQEMKDLSQTYTHKWWVNIFMLSKNKKNSFIPKLTLIHFFYLKCREKKLTAHLGIIVFDS